MLGSVDGNSGFIPARDGGDKELRALYRIARLLQDDDRPTLDVIAEVLAVVPSGWRFPHILRARVFFRDLEVRSPGFQPTPWVQSARFATRNGDVGGIDVCYLEERPSASEGPFLAEERNLIDSLADILRSHFQHVTALEALHQAHHDLEVMVLERTAQLEEANRSFEQQVVEHRRDQARIEEYQRRLQKVASELSLTEARQRRVIAQELHDQIGQALAFIRMKIMRFRGDAVFCGFESSIEDILRLLTQTINSTRSLTFEISPPVLYELGLASALEWLGERLGSAHEIPIDVSADESLDALPDDMRIVLFQAVRELVVNAIKHADPQRVTIRGGVSDHGVRVVVSDDGRGFDVGQVREAGVDGMTFGLFSIRERLAYMGGHMDIESTLGEGTSVALITPLGGTPGEVRP